MRTHSGRPHRGWRHSIRGVAGAVLLLLVVLPMCRARHRVSKDYPGYFFLCYRELEPFVGSFINVFIVTTDVGAGGNWLPSIEHMDCYSPEHTRAFLVSPRTAGTIVSTLDRMGAFEWATDMPKGAEPDYEDRHLRIVTDGRVHDTRLLRGEGLFRMGKLLRAVADTAEREGRLLPYQAINPRHGAEQERRWLYPVAIARGAKTWVGIDRQRQLVIASALGDCFSPAQVFDDAHYTFVAVSDDGRVVAAGDKAGNILI